MIYITQGKQGSIGIEALLKSLLILPKNSLKHLTIVLDRVQLRHELESLRIPFVIHDTTLELQQRHITLLDPKFSEYSETLNSLLTALSLVQPTDSLFTLPSSKDQFFYQGRHYRGYTDFFRTYFHRNDLSMIFKSNHFDLLLLTDHLPLSEVAEKINAHLFQKIEITLLGSKKHFSKYEHVVVLGLNPHAGENGQIGKEELAFEKYLLPLRTNFPEVLFTGPIAADSLFFKSSNTNKKTLVVSLFHDQALPVFKALNMLHAAQITFGLPFLRLSVVHGTGEDIYGKNLADPTSILYGLNSAFTSTYGLHFNRTSA